MLANDRPDQGLLGHVLCEHRDLHAAISAVRSLLREPGYPGVDRSEPLAAELCRLRDHVACHFRQEERGGFMEESAVRLPRLARRVRQVLAEHPPLLEELDALVSESRFMADRRPADVSKHWNALSSNFEAFAQRLVDHERHENAVVQEGYNEDLGLLE
jgi:iron-sulfur cluster repair protein YtfE (RIC family)